MPRALFVVYDFPPATSSGVFRPLRFLKRLPEFGWSATVIAPRFGHGTLRDPELLRSLPEEVHVIRTLAPEPRLLQLVLNRLHLGGIATGIDRWWRLPDPQRAWVPFAVRAAMHALKDQKHDVLWTSSAPYSAHLAGHEIRRRAGIPWVADFRDEWTTHPDLMALLPTEYHRGKHRRWEQKILGMADAVSGVSEPFVAELRKSASGKRPERFFTLPNGFDEDDFANAPPPPEQERFTVLYPGRVYGQEPLYTFLEGARRAIDSGRIDPDRLLIEFVGHGNQQLDSCGLPAQCFRASGQIPHHQAIHRIRSASLLLLLADAHRGAGVFPGKIFPFLASGRPILAIAAKDAGVSMLLREAGHRPSIEPGDVIGTCTAFSDAFRRWRTGVPVPPVNTEVVSRFSSRRQTGVLVEHFEKLRKPQNA